MSEENYLLELWTKYIGPNCGNPSPTGRRVGSGQTSKGGFCRLDCYAGFYEFEIGERARRISEALKRHQGS